MLQQTGGAAGRRDLERGAGGRRQASETLSIFLLFKGTAS